VTFLVFQSSYYLLPACLTTQRYSRDITLSALPRCKHNKRTCRLFLYIIALMLNVKQGSCECQLFKSLVLTWWGNQAQVYRLYVPDALTILPSRQLLLPASDFKTQIGWYASVYFLLWNGLVVLATKSYLSWWKELLLHLSIKN